MADGPKAFIPLFPEKDVPSLLEALLKASASLKKQTDQDHENWLSRKLYALLIQIYPFRDGPLDIRLQPEIVFFEVDSNFPAGQIDFIVSCGMGAATYFAIEAKRLRVRTRNGKLIPGNKEYVDDGMMRFVTGRYSPSMKAAAMIGYVFDGNIQKARSGVGKCVHLNARKLKLLAPEILLKSCILGKDSVDETKHELGDREFVLYHLFVPVWTNGMENHRRI